MKKKISLVAVLLVGLLACFSLLACGLFGDDDDGYEGDQILEYALNEDGNSYSLVGIRDIEDTDIIIPSTYNDMPVTSIGEGAFRDCSSLTSIIIPDSVTSIGEGAFRDCTSLTSIIIPDNVTSIGEYAFSGCGKITSITIPESVTNIGDYAFSGCESIPSVTIPSGVTRIGESTFRSCYSLTDVTIPESVKSIGNYAFWDCDSLTSITILESVTRIGGSAFGGCDSLESITLPFIGETKDGTNKMHFGYIFGADRYDSNDLYVPKSLKSVIITGGSSIDSYAFYKCSSIESITLPESVTSIGGYAFYECRAGINWGENPSITDIEGYAFYEYKGASITIPDSVTSIESYAFGNCVSLTSITIPESVTSIERRAFGGCNSLESITLPFVGETKDGTNKMHFGYIFGADKYDSNDLYVPKSLKSVIITGGSSIGGYAFYKCSSIEGLTLPDSITSIGGYAFYECRAEINWGENPSITEIGANAFISYKGVSLTIPESVTVISDYAFSFCNNVESITIPASVTSIGEGAFSGWGSLESITVDENNTAYHSISNCLIHTATDTLILGCKNSIIPDSVTSIGSYAFEDCTGADSITIPDSVTSIGMYAFEDCDLEIKWGENPSITSIVSRAFSRYAGVSITIPDSVTKIDYNAFEDCDNLESITLPFIGETKDGTSNTHFGYIFGAGGHGYNDQYVPKSLKSVIITDTSSIGSYAFYNCDRITSITLPENVMSIGNSAFYECNSIESLTLPDRITSIGEYAFSGCSAEIKWGKNPSIADIGINAFRGYKGVSITIPESVKSIGESAFMGCDSLTSITIPESVTSIEKSAFGGCDNLESITLPFIGETKDGTSNTHFGYIFGANKSDFNGYSVPESLERVIITGGSSIESYAFYGCRITSITLPESVTSIGEYAFYTCGLNSITLPENITSIGNLAFSECNYLKTVYWDATNCFTAGTSRTIFGGYYNDINTTLKTVIIGDNVQTIPNKAFSGCENITSITIPNGVTNIGASAFRSCSSLNEITIPDSVTSIGQYAFDGTAYYKDDGNWENSVLYIGKHLIVANSTASEKCVIKEGTLVIADYAFSKLDLTSITIPEGVVAIGAYAFQGNSYGYGSEKSTGPSSVVIPDSVMMIGDHAFEGNRNLTNVTIGSGIKYIGHGVFELSFEKHDDCVSSFGNHFYSSKERIYIEYNGTQQNWDAVQKESDWIAKMEYCIFSALIKDCVDRNYTMTFNE